VCLEANTRSHALVHAAGAFTLNILADEQAELGKKFAYDRQARNAPQIHAPGFVTERGALILYNILGYFECEVAAEYPGGDHTIFLARVVNAQVEASRAGPLVYYNGKWSGLGEGER
jgi:flavin reductase (DIM6/NTAB) family NADH-FMN oxidoreductase RutF